MSETDRRKNRVYQYLALKDEPVREEGGYPSLVEERSFVFIGLNECRRMR